MRVLVLCGTHHQPFDRLVDAAAALAQAGHVVTVQRGASRSEAPGCAVVEVVAPDALGALADQADRIVGHAAPGTAFLAWERGQTPILVPRRSALGEHVDDHQTAFAARVAGRALVVHDLAQLVAMCGQQMAPQPRREAPVSEAFVRDFSALADKVVAQSRRARPKRARVRDVLLALGSCLR